MSSFKKQANTWGKKGRNQIIFSVLWAMLIMTIGSIIASLLSGAGMAPVAITISFTFLFAVAVGTTRFVRGIAYVWKASTIEVELDKENN